MNPQILGAAQMDPKVVFVTTCLIAGIGSIAMGIFANLPVALAPAMGLNAFFAFVVVGRWVSLGRPGWARYSGAQLGYFAHAVSYPLLDDLQHSIKFTYWHHQRNRIIYCLNGIKNTGVIVANKDTPVMIGDLSSHGVLLGILGFYYNRVVITSFSCRGAGFYCGDVLLWIIFR